MKAKKFKGLLPKHIKAIKVLIDDGWSTEKLCSLFSVTPEILDEVAKFKN